MADPVIGIKKNSPFLVVLIIQNTLSFSFSFFFFFSFSYFHPFIECIPKSLIFHSLFTYLFTDDIHRYEKNKDKKIYTKIRLILLYTYITLTLHQTT